MMETNCRHITKSAPSWAWKLVKRRKKLSDPFFYEGDIVCQLAHKQLSVAEDKKPNRRLVEFPCHISSCLQVFNTVTAYEAHYNSVHRNVCGQCRRSFPTSHLLDVHLLEWHDSMFQILSKKQNMFQCLVQECSKKFSTAKERKDHVIKIHHYPSNFRFDRPHKIKSKMAEPKTEPSNHGDVVMDIEVIERRDGLDSVTMETSNPSQDSSRRFVYKVPKNICFGHGAARGFQRLSATSQGKKRSRKKHWHQQVAPPDQDTCVDIEEVNMKDLTAALEN